MDMESLQAIERTRYNPWQLRRPLPHGQSVDLSFRLEAQFTPLEKSLLWFHAFTGCKGVEFVAFCAAEFKRPVELTSGIILVPCFVPLNNARIGKDFHRTSAMGVNGRFIYDGWMPLEDWNAGGVRRAVRSISEAMSVLGLQGAQADWEPKYYQMREIDGWLPADDRHVQGQHIIARALDQLPEEDRIAIFRSLGWLSQGMRGTIPAAKFLSFFAAIESLVTHIQNAGDGSPMHSIRAEGPLKEERKEIILRIIGEQLYDDPFKAVNRAYFEGVRSLSKTLEAQLQAVFGEGHEALALMFEKRSGKRSLFDYRNKIVHGSLGSESELESEEIRRRLWDMESVARGFLLRIIQAIDPLPPEDLYEGGPEEPLDNEDGDGDEQRLHQPGEQTPSEQDRIDAQCHMADLYRLPPRLR